MRLLNERRIVENCIADSVNSAHSALGAFRLRHRLGGAHGGLQVALVSILLLSTSPFFCV
jgi:hypothetical protein